ncbi:tetratricopeptide repeat protein [Chitinophaga arvensicola]|uniref:Outer membrane protein, YaiO family n=1 Tax=Chitinophaga arvensicola TaxID=29529 RepID=A0A1I0RJ66_9BACT|nr:tetratricopeptide repeat protein [Chitinophaga arvensicola]SEW41025.1 outer membrane protein, YaiO family [Chitinophaga arvensicola]
MAVLKHLLTGILVCLAMQTQAQIFKQKNNAEALYEQALQETKQQHYDKAIALSQQALKAQPDFIDQQLLLARLYMLTKQYDLSRKYVKEVLAKNPQYRDAYYYAINVELTTGKYAEAECYADEALSQFPGSREFMLKKLGILDMQHKVYRGNELAETVLNKYPEDTTVRNAYVEHYLLSGKYYQQLGNSGMARQSYDRVLLVEPRNQEAREASLGVALKGGNYQSALEQVNDELLAHPGSYDLLMRKLGILQEMHAYVEALSTLQEVLRRFPGDAKARTLETSLRMEAATYYANMDPYTLYQGVLEKNPGNREALDKLIGYSMARGAYAEALAWINRGLKATPNDTRLLGLKMDVLEGDRKYGSAAALAMTLYQRAPNPELKERLVQLQTATGREYLAQQQYDLALAAFETAGRISPGDSSVLNLLTNTYISQKNTPAALKTLDQALTYYPDNATFLLKKSSVLADAGRYEEAAVITAQLAARYPTDERFSSNLADMRLTSARALMKADEYDLAKQQLALVLAAAPSNSEALDYMINMQTATGKPDSALYYANTALGYYPDNRDFLLKKASVLQEMHAYNESAAITSDLMTRYPYTIKYKQAYVSSLMSAGTDYQRNQQPDSALAMFNQVLALQPKDSMALLYSINILNGQQRYDSALVYTAQGMKYYPGNEAFLMKRAITLENKQDFTAAALVADSIVKLQPTAANTDYRDYLLSKTLKNQFGLYFNNSSYDYTSDKFNIATVEYRRFIKRGSYAVQLNYAGRKNGNGLQGLAEMYYKHNPKLYSYGMMAFSNKSVFPQVRAAYSIFKTFKKDIEVELGGRYLNVDSTTSISGVLSIAKPFGDFWINLRGFAISETSSFYTSFNLTTRYYMNKQQDYLQLVAGLGTSPDDKSRLVNFPNLSGLLTRSISAGYQKVVHYRTTLGLYGTWINQKISDTGFQNQYDIYLSLQRKF